jgi:hypothetical protein
MSWERSKFNYMINFKFKLNIFGRLVGERAYIDIGTFIPNIAPDSDLYDSDEVCPRNSPLPERSCQLTCSPVLQHDAGRNCLPWGRACADGQPRGECGRRTHRLYCSDAAAAKAASVTRQAR